MDSQNGMLTIVEMNTEVEWRKKANRRTVWDCLYKKFKAMLNSTIVYLMIHM